MAKSDPKTETRRGRFQAYCRDRGWFDDEHGRWRVAQISAATLKPTNKVSDLLNGKGSFGSKIARELEAALDLDEFYFDGVDPAPDRKQSEREVKPAVPPADDSERVAGDVIDVIDHYLASIDEDGREIVALALMKFAKNPKGERDRAVGMLASAMRTPQDPVDPAPTKIRKSRASVKAALKPKLEVRPGGGQQQMFKVPTPPLRKIMRDQDAPLREQEWYEKLPKVPKVR